MYGYKEGERYTGESFKTGESSVEKMVKRATNMMEFYKGKRVLITGHTGFKGSWLCKILADAGAVVTGFSLEPPTNPNLFSLCSVEQEIKSVIGDIRDC